MIKLLIVTLAGVAIAASGPTESETIDYGHGVQVFGKMLRQFINTQPEDVKVSEGVHLVTVQSDNNARAISDDKTILGSVENYLKTHEIRIRLPELMPGDGFGRAFKDAMDGIQTSETQGTGRGKKGGGMGGIALMGLMMGKMMAAMGLGGVGLLAMKALMVSALALMLSLIIGLKKLVSSHDDGGGGHHVIHAGGGGHGHDYRKKREASEMAYRAWSPYNASS